MPRCPSCGKGGFNSHEAVARHMGQPRSGCSSWLDNLVNIHEDLLGRSRDGHNSSCTTSTGDGSGGLDEDNQWVSNDEEMFDGTQEDSQSSPIEFFPGAAQTFAGGSTFLDQFDADEFSSYRSSNIYYPFASRVLLYWRDPVELIQYLLNRPNFQNAMELTPYWLYDTASRLCHVYTEWMSGDNVWWMQSQIPVGATLLGTVLSFDKTNISVLTGDRVAHPLLISLANIKMATRLKSSSNSFLLAALLPVPKFVHKNSRIRGILENRLIHQCQDIVLEPLKCAAKLGIMLSDPYIVDTPEAAMLAGVRGKTSPVTMAMYKQFGDSFWHEPRTSLTTLCQLVTVASKVDPSDIELYLCEALKLRLNGVHLPFWRDIPLSCPSRFFNPEVLHYLHKEFWDHNVQWCINALGTAEIDFRFSVLQPVMGFRHFKEGISSLRQVTGRTHRDIQRTIIAVIAGSAPVQAYRITEVDIELINSALQEFHAHKDSIVTNGLHRGKGKKPIDNWYIPKIELMQSMAPSISRVGMAIQWSADITEHTHIDQIKDPARASNNNNYDPQICRQLDRLEKCRNFELALSLKDPERWLDTPAETGDEPDDEMTDPSVASRPITDHFSRSIHLASSALNSIPLPHHSFSVGCVVFNLSYDPHIRRISVDDAAKQFSLVDLRAALADFLVHEKSHGIHLAHAIGGGSCRATESAALPFEYIQVWFKLRLQTKDIHTDAILPAQTLCASPPEGNWQYGRYDSVVVNTDSVKTWPTSSLQGHLVVQLHLIMQPLGKPHERWSWADRFLTYVQRFDIVLQADGYRDPSTQMHVLRRAIRSGGQHLGDVIPVSQLRAYANLVPCFGPRADSQLTSFNSSEHCCKFFLNKYFDKNTYYAMSV
ncbi:hypothetical protein SCLCIDRAFT_28909 [Scleroderma citrinum Foug A]|uniref:DUF6830 domain-containing protein n=1 Tax=Scleroderma citrinum Foug A TaxID=1036808 RepID=A0A0C3DMN4_9AGAM|nr:hypothetical protein SCLCIDRAFT_28909 [Scleroderma citrinum Foug A]